MSKPLPIGLPVEPPPNIDLAKAAAIEPGPENDRMGFEGLPSDYVFDLDYTDTRGRKWVGKFKAHILTIQQRAQVGLTRARLLNGISLASLDSYTLQLLEMQAYLAIALDSSPEWAKKVDSIRDVAVLNALYQEVANYEGRYFRTGSEA